MTTYMIRKAKDEDGKPNDNKHENKRVEAVSPRAARRQFCKSNSLYPTAELICE